MGKHSDTDKAVRNIMNWAGRSEWADEQTAAFDAHLAPVCERIGISHDELGQELADQGYGGMLFGIMFEDFLSRHLRPDGSNIIDDYLKRRGWRESVPGRRYLQQLRDSVLSLYEIVEVSPGHHCDVRDLARGGKVVRVYERMGTQNMVKWDRIAARVLDTHGRHTFSGGLLPFPQEAAQSLLKVLTESRKAFDKELARMAGKEAAAKRASKNLDELFLRDAAPAFTSLWLMHTLERLRAPLPAMVNRDGEALVFTETRFPFLTEQLEEIVRRLDAAADWEKDNPDEQTWIWFPDPEPDADSNDPQHGLAIETFQDGQRPISGTLELTPGVLKLTSNSIERAERGKPALEALLHGLIGPALSKLQTPEQLLAERDALNPDDDDQVTDTIDPEIAAEVIHNMLDQHYHQCLDEPIPVLDNKTPRQCARSKKGREQVVEWLKHLENNEQRRASRQGQTPYDSGWMWDELKLTEYRDC